MNPVDDKWAAADAYETFMGRWSREVARSFVPWLGVPKGASWLEVGCGTGALTGTICGLADPASVVACDPSLAFVEYVATRLRDPRVSGVVAGAENLPDGGGRYGCVVSGLVLNFLPDPKAAVVGMRGRTASNGVIAGYVWDYAAGMEFLRLFWDAASALDPAARELDEARRFPLASRGALESLFVEAGLDEVRSRAIDVPTRFASFEEFWKPFEGGTGPAPAYVASLSGDRREALRDRLARALRAGPDGGIPLKARAWAVRGTHR